VEITLPKALKKIGARAFFRCEKLKKITFPYNLEEIGDKAFASCERLVDIGNGFSPSCNVHISAFSDDVALEEAAKTAEFDTPIKWGRDLWEKKADEDTRYAVLLAVQSIRDELDATKEAELPSHTDNKTNNGDERRDETKGPKLGRLLAVLPSGDNNERPKAEGQVLRKILGYVGTRKRGGKRGTRKQGTRKRGTRKRGIRKRGGRTIHSTC
jgi:hypothetical protein